MIKMTGNKKVDFLIYKLAKAEEERLLMSSEAHKEGCPSNDLSAIVKKIEFLVGKLGEHGVYPNNIGARLDFDKGNADSKLDMEFNEIFVRELSDRFLVWLTYDEHPIIEVTFSSLAGSKEELNLALQTANVELGSAMVFSSFAYQENIVFDLGAGVYNHHVDAVSFDLEDDEKKSLGLMHVQSFLNNHFKEFDTSYQKSEGAKEIGLMAVSSN